MYPTAKPRQDGASERYRPCTISIWKVLEITSRFSSVPFALFHAATPYLMSDLWQNIIFTYICIFKALNKRRTLNSF